MTAVLDAAPRQLTAEVTRPIHLTRLTLVELRKLGDTRAGFWLLIVIGLATVGTSAVILGWAPAADQKFSDYYEFGLVPGMFLLPVLGILAMTSEWSQRTAVTTFALVPARGRVFVAKLLAGCLVAVASVLAIAVLSAAANLLGLALGGDGSWSADSSIIWQGLLAQLIFVLMGMGFGALLLNSPLAIVTYLVLPTLWSVLGETIKALKTAAGWLDLNVTSSALSEPSMTSSEYARLAVSTAVWVLLPLLAGAWRTIRREVS